MPDRIMTLHPTNGRQVWKSVLTQPSGGDDSGRPIGLDPATNKFNAAFVPDSNTSILPVTASETIPNRRLVNLWDSTGRKCRLSLGTYAKRVGGYVATGGASGETLNVQINGEVVFDIGSTGVTASDMQAPMYADPTNAGLPTKTAPSTTNQARQYIGYIVGVDAGNSIFTLKLEIGESEELI